MRVDDALVGQDVLFTALLDQLQQHTVSDCLLAYSGGVDSQVLLHLLYRLRQSGVPLTIRAFHINHQLQPQAQAWQQHCADICKKWRIAFSAERITVAASPDEGIEAAARQLRYQALADALAPGQCLLTAHHSNDQAETVLLQALRGAGVKGLAAMPRGLTAFAAGSRLRPLLACSKAQLLSYARAHQLEWVEDSSNHEVRYSRNWLRQSIMPQLVAHRQGALTNLSRLADNMAEAQSILDEVASADYETVQSKHDPSRINIIQLQQLTAARQRLLLRYWLAKQRCLLPSRRRLAQIQTCIIQASDDANPCVSWGCWQLRRFADYLYVLPLVSNNYSDYRHKWIKNKTLYLPGDLGALEQSYYPSDAVKKHFSSEVVTVCFRQGGERYLQKPGGIHKKLKKSMQQWHIPPWQRTMIPLVYCGDNLVAVVGYWQYELKLSSNHVLHK